MNAAQVVCRELGFARGVATAVEPEDLPNRTVYEVMTISYSNTLRSITSAL